MKSISLLLLIYSTYILAQNPVKINIKEHILEADFLKNKFAAKYYQLGDFTTIKKGSKIKLAKVLTDNGWNYIDEKGRQIIELDYLKITDYHDISNGIISVNYTTTDKLRNTRRCFGLVHYKNGFITDECYNSQSINTLNPESNTSLAVYPIYNEDFFLTAENKAMQIRDFSGKQVIDRSFGNIKIIEQFIIARDEYQNMYKEQNFYVYNKQGKLLKTFFGFSLDFYLNHFILRSSKGYQFIRSDNFMPGIDKYFENISFSRESSNKLFTATTLEDDKRYYNFINGKLETVKIPFEEGDTEFYYSKNFIRKRNIKDHPTTYFIYDLNGNLVGKYASLKYGIIESIALGKIHDPQFMIKHNSELDEIIKYFMGYDNKQGIGVVYVKKNDKEEQIFYDRNSGELLFSKARSFGYFKKYDTRLKCLLFTSKDGELFVNRKGKTVKKLQPQLYSLDYTLHDNKSQKAALMNKNYDAASGYYDEIKFLFTHRNTGYYLARNGDYNGIIDHHGNIIYKFENQYISVLNPDDGEYFIIQKPDGLTEIIAIKNLKTFLKIKLKPDTQISLNKEKIFIFYSPDSNSNFSLDQYGNSVKFY